MKQKDIAIILVVCFVAAILSFFVSSKLFGTTGDKAQKAETVDVISTQFKAPNSTYFNTNSIDPTQPIVISPENNTNPFAVSN